MSTEWTPELLAFRDDCDTETWEAFKADALDAMTGLTAAGRDVYVKLDWRKSARLTAVIRRRMFGVAEPAPTSRVTEFLGKPAVRITAPAMVDDLEDL